MDPAVTQSSDCDRPSSGTHHLRTLLSAYACNPNEGSEPGVGWEWLIAWAKIADVTLLTRRNNVDDVQGKVNARLPADAKPITVVPLDLSALWLALKRRIPFGVQIYYWRWQRLARLYAVENAAAFDVAHHVTFAADWLPAGVVHPDVPLPTIWGPVGGDTYTPLRLLRILPPAERLKELLRWAVTALLRQLMLRRANHDPSVSVALNSDSARAIRVRGYDAIIEPNAAIDLGSIGSNHVWESSSRLLYAGRLVHWKGPILAIRALTHLPATFTLEVFGDGPAEAYLVAEVRRLALSDRVWFRGNIEREALLAEFTNCRALLAPSLHDSAPWTVAEALSAGCPVVALDAGGPGEFLRLADQKPLSLKAADIPRSIARAVVNCQAPTINERFDRDRLPGLLAKWADLAMERSSTHLEEYS